jgi:hypothetical protein
MPETFYVRTSDLKHYIEAKILTDLEGNPIVSRNPIQSTWNLFDAGHNPIGTNTSGYVIAARAGKLFGGFQELAQW